MPPYTTAMINLSAAGLSETEARCYTALLEQEAWKPAELAKYVNETRTNCYKILDNLVAKKLAERFDRNKKLHYRANNPSQLLELARQERAVREQAESALENNTQALLATYYRTHEQPGVRYFQGEQEIGEIFSEIACANEEAVFVNTTAGIDFYGFDTMHELRMRAVKANVPRRTITPDTHLAAKDYKLTDPLVQLKRTWFREGDYTAPVEWGAFDDKLYVISYGQEALGLIIESQQIADSFKQLFAVMERGQKALPDYYRLPRRAGVPARIQPTER